MRNHEFVLALLYTATIVIAQTITLTFSNGQGPTIVQVFTTDDQGFPIRTNIATLSGNTTPTSPSTPGQSATYLPTKPSTTSTPTSRTSHTSSSSSTIKSPGVPIGSSQPEKTKGLSAGAIAGFSVTAVILVALAFFLCFVRRRKRQRRRLSTRFAKNSVDMQLIPNPFPSDAQQREPGHDLPHRPARQIDAKFITAELGAAENSPPRPTIPQILITREGETIGRPMTPSISGHDDTQDLISPTNHNPTNIKSVPRSSSPEGAPLPNTFIRGSISDIQVSQADIAQSMRDLLGQLERHVAAPSSDSDATVVLLQRQVEMLQRENEELRLAGLSEAPPAYDGRF